MALAKLWNAVFGKRPEANQIPTTQSAADSVPTIVAPIRPIGLVKPSSGQANAEQIVAKTKSIASLPATTTVSKKPIASTVSISTAIDVKQRKSKTKKSRQDKVAESIEPVIAPASSPVLRMFRRKNNAWTKLIGSRTINVILDMNVQDGTRAVELLEAIVDSNSPSPKYVAIGMFELAGEALTVRQFHQKVRAAGGQPVVIPMPLVEGLRRMSQTVGAADLILLDITDQQIADPVIARLLQRITATHSLVLRRDAKDRWQTAPLKQAA